MGDRELLAALNVEAEHPVLLAVLELIDRAKDECVGHAVRGVGSDRDVAFYLGGREALENLERYLVEARARAAEKV